ncbi:hypothetical protein C2845_PM14G12360 [Panicum miliaceum]|uniref:Uncharacterized protein n=1 Tax=Panicum miliaceum TaxID=4540 RepID=A0A3L6PTV5_PANMI|nr:hypothetical protein C2845_PM14G12360 [Panicum miliaceum]
MDRRYPLGDVTNITSLGSGHGRKRLRAESNRPYLVVEEQIPSVECALPSHEPVFGSTQSVVTKAETGRKTRGPAKGLNNGLDDKKGHFDSGIWEPDDPTLAMDEDGSEILKKKGKSLSRKVTNVANVGTITDNARVPTPSVEDLCLY